VRTALERKGLAPEAVIGGARPAARSSADEAVAAAQQAAALRAAAGNRPDSVFEQHARALDERATSAGDVPARLSVRGPVTVTAAMLDRLNPSVVS
jgi:hypothetical protein